MGEPFKGTINVDIRDSVPDWAPFEPPKAPDGAASVVYIVLDDVGFSAMRCYGGPIETPNIDRIANDADISAAMTVPPQTTRARLRGEFVKRAKERRRDFTVDWVHLKLNDQAQRTVLLKDPFKSKDERVEKLIAGL